jgi:hypothetical protein
MFAADARAQAVDSSLSFFITGRSLGTGGNLGGLAGADAHCQLLADSVGAGSRLWRAYLSTQAVGETPAINARDRIGTGPWFNANKVMIAANLTVLHDTANRATISSANGLTHRGATVPNNQHDIVTGTKLTGMAPAAGADSTCANWTSSTTGGALVGHHNRSGISSNICQSCWNESHRTNGCTQSNLQQGGGAGYFYCFAADAGGTGLIPRELPRRIGQANGHAPYLLGPGPRSSEIVYRFELARETRVEVTAHDLEGRGRALLARGVLGTGPHAIRWDGTDARGEALPPGLYLIVRKSRD